MERLAESGQGRGQTPQTLLHATWASLLLIAGYPGAINKWLHSDSKVAYAFFAKLRSICHIATTRRDLKCRLLFIP